MMSILIVCFVKKKDFMITMLFTNIIEIDIFNAICAKRWGKKSKTKKLVKLNLKFSMILKCCTNTTEEVIMFAKKILAMI